MSELINTCRRSKQVLWQLLNTASALSLVGAMSAIPNTAAARDEDRPTVWIELGGALQRVDTSEEKYAPPFLFETPRPSPETIDPLGIGHLPRSAFEAEGRITFQPEGSSWNFVAAARFGRSKAHQNLHQQSNKTGPVAHLSHGGPIYQYIFEYIDARKASSESHAVIDFQVGKDVGFGMFGAGGSSTFNLGVRFAQFSAKSSTSFGSDPHAQQYIQTVQLFPGYTFPLLTDEVYQVNKAASAASRRFHGIGPSLSWNGSAPVVGDTHDGEIVLDWGVNAAILFGRQTADTNHKSTSRYFHRLATPQYTTSHPDPGTDRHRSRSVTVPNVGAFAGITYRIQNFKLSAGYRADFFFGAMDGGIDTRKTEDEKFYGPFATISFGL